MPHNAPLLPSYSKDHYHDDDGKFKKPKSYHPPPPQSPTAFRRRLPTILLLSFSALCLVVGVSGIAFASAALRRPPRIATVFRCGRDEDVFRTYRSKYLAASADSKEEESSVAAARPKVLGLVGVYTGYSAADRRAALRSTWFPADPDALLRLEHATGLAFRFVIGQTKDSKKMVGLQNEIDTYHDFMSIDVDEDDLKLPHKTLAFFKAAFNLFDAEYYVKIADNIYLRPDRLSILLAKDRAHHLTYIGCMTKGPVITDPKMKWYESSGHLIGNEYFLHAYGLIYILSAQVVESLANARNDSLRMFSNEDIAVGSWMLSMNVNHEDNRALCHTKCTATSIAVWDMPKCSGLCNPVERMAELHSVTMCSGSPTMSSEEEEEK